MQVSFSGKAIKAWGNFGRTIGIRGKVIVGQGEGSFRVILAGATTFKVKTGRVVVLPAVSVAETMIE